MAVASSQGTRVYWGGRLIGRITSAKSSQATGSEFDCTNLTSPVIGSGANTRVVRQVNPVDIAPSSVSVELLGGAQFTQDDLGRIAVLTVSTSGGRLSGNAYLAEFSADASTGAKLKSVATFKFTGF